MIVFRLRDNVRNGLQIATIVKGSLIKETYIRHRNFDRITLLEYKKIKNSLSLFERLVNIGFFRESHFCRCQITYKWMTYSSLHIFEILYVKMKNIKTLCLSYTTFIITKSQYPSKVWVMVLYYNWGTLWVQGTLLWSLESQILVSLYTRIKHYRNQIYGKNSYTRGVSKTFVIVLISFVYWL